MGFGWLLLGWAVAAEPATVQQIHELYWRRADALNLAAQIAGADADTRVEAVRALGWLGTPDALPVLEGMQADRALPVQVAVADALARVPGGADVARGWLSSIGSPGPGRAGERVERYGALVRALGVGGGARDVPVVAAALRESWPVASVAARALTAMALREVPGVDAAVPALISRLRGPDPRVVADVARALAHVGLGDDVTPTDVAVVRDRLRRGTTPEVQAFLLRALWPAASPEERQELFLASATDTARLVQVAALGSLLPGDLPADVVSTFLAHPDPWIRQAAMGALGRDPSPEATDALRRHSTEAPPWEAALALRALRLADDGRALDHREPAPVRAALVPLIVRPETLVRLALVDEVPMVRSGAAGALEARADAGPRWGRRLLEADDPVVRWAGVRMLRRGGARSVPQLKELLLREEDHAVQTEAIRGLAAHPGRVRGWRGLASVLLRVRSSDSPVLRQAVDALTAALGADGPSSRAPRGPDVAQTRAIRGALVRTDHGTFRLELDPDGAPRAVATFAALAEEGAYDDVVVYSAAPGEEIRTGCRRGDGWGDPGFAAPAELSPSDFRRGTVAMVGHPLGGVGSQWLVRTGDLSLASTSSARTSTPIGHVTAGQHVVDRLAAGAKILGVAIERVP